MKNFFIILAIIVSIPILFPLYLFIWPPLLVILFFWYITRNITEVKGEAGEKKVNKRLEKLDPQSYKLFKDLYIPNGKGGITQIDHVVTSPYGIFVIETKNYNGLITGDQYSQNWTQQLSKGNGSKFYNPIWQNYGHVESLKTFLNKEELESIYSIIVFAGNATLRFEKPIKSARVIKIHDLIKVIKEKGTTKIHLSELQEMNRKLAPYEIKDKKFKEEVKDKHVHDIKKNLKGKALDEYTKLMNRICPKCGGEVLLKNGKYGEFVACHNFPKCKYTKSLK